MTEHRELSFKEAQEIISIEEGNNPHEYTLTCNYCGQSKRAETDAPVEILTQMARWHRENGCGEEVSHG